MSITITCVLGTQVKRTKVSLLRRPRYDWRRSPPYESREDAAREMQKINAWIGRPEPIDDIPWLRGHKGLEIVKAYITDDAEITE